MKDRNMKGKNPHQLNAIKASCEPMLKYQSGLENKGDWWEGGGDKGVRVGMCWSPRQEFQSTAEYLRRWQLKLF